MDTKVVWNHWLVKTTKHVREIKMLKIYSFWLLHFQLKKLLGNTGRYFLFDFYLILKYFSENLKQQVKQSILQNWTKHFRACQMSYSVYSQQYIETVGRHHISYWGLYSFFDMNFPIFSKDRKTQIRFQPQTSTSRKAFLTSRVVKEYYTMSFLELPSS